MEHFLMERVALDITYECSLNCKLCGTYSPYMSPSEKKFSLDHWIRVIDQYFKIVDSVRVFTISGGEPLLFSEFPELINIIFNYRDRINECQIATNGTIVPSRRTLEAAKNFGNKLYFIVDNYGSEISRNIDEIDAVLTQENIRHIVRNYTKNHPHCGGWVDFGTFKEKKCETLREAETLFSKCAFASKIHFCFPITGSKMWPCPPARRRAQLGFEADPSEYIDLFDDSLSIEEQREKIRAIYGKKSLSACAYCTGLCEDSARVAPGEQLTPEEMKYVRAGAACYADVLQMMQATHNGGHKTEFEKG